MTIGSLPLHLTYSTAFHRADRWTEVRGILDRLVLPIRQRVAPRRRFELGLHLSGRAAIDLEAPRALAELREWLARHDVAVCTLNGGPYGRFVGQAFKSAAYRPDWLDEERLRHADRLALLLAGLLPPDGFGTINTIGAAFRARVRSRLDDAAIADRLLRHVAVLARIRERTGKTIALTLEPEPACRFETIGETVEFFDRHIHGRAAAVRVGALAGLAPAAAVDAIHRHLGVCLDASHAALEFEEPAMALRALELAGVAVWKVQLSTALRARYPFERQTRDALHALASDGTLHQVIVRTSGSIRRFVDLPLALAAPPPHAVEWRVNVHLPVALPASGSLGTTQAGVANLLASLARRASVRHLEIDLGALRPDGSPSRAADVVEALARDLVWVDAHLPPLYAQSA